MTSDDPNSYEPPKSSEANALDRARAKAYRRLLPLLFLCYVIAYVDRNNLSIAIETMQQDMPAFNKDVLGTGAGIFFLGYFLLEIPGSLLVERWSARKWISRIMISWGLVAAFMAAVKTPAQFYTLRFILGLAEAGFFPGVIIYLTHWFPSRDRSRALSWFLIGTPVAQVDQPVSLLPSALDRHHQETRRHHDQRHPGARPARVAMGLHRLGPARRAPGRPRPVLPDRPAEAGAMAGTRRARRPGGRARPREGRAFGEPAHAIDRRPRNPKVLVLATAYFFIVTGNYGVEFFLPSILGEWYKLPNFTKMGLLVIPAAGSLVGQLFIGWSSDRTKERQGPHGSTDLSGSGRAGAARSSAATPCP